MNISTLTYGLSEQVLEKLTTVFASFNTIDEAVLFGSRANGTFKEGSDIDIALKGQELNINLLRKIELEIDAQFLPYVVDLVIFNNIEEPLLIEHIDRIGICIYTKIIVYSSPSVGFSHSA